ncbi:MAG TPA: thiamine-phosphate kinase [Actinomycetota bacterium]|nr:thiamine-phosphate kinase [Actinomycetota bacterium]
MEPGEDRLVAAIARVLSGPGPEVRVGVGDDAAVLAPGRGDLLLTTDLLVEGVHFERSWTPPRDLGFKAIAVNVSDVAAMAGSPRYAVVGLGMPPDVDDAWALELLGGMRAACDEHALWLVGGDLSRAERVVVSVAVVGEAPPGGAVTRTGARPGDRVVVTGWLGAAAGGLLLARGPGRGRALGTEAARVLLAALARPTPRVGEGRTLARAGATAMIDLSDGLALDLARLCRASGVGARVTLAAVPVAPALIELRDELGADPLELALSGGEDYELLATLPPAGVAAARAELRERFGVSLAEIGGIIEGEGLSAIGPDGRESPLEPRGWDHRAGG